MIQLQKHRSNSNGVPIISKRDIEYFAEVIIKDYNPSMLEVPTILDIEDFTEFYVGLEIDYKDLTSDKSTIGMIIFSDGNVPIYDIKEDKAKNIWAKKGTIIIDNSLLKKNQLARGRFTLCHELGHWILHRHIYEANQNENQISIFDGLNEKKASLVKCRDVDIESTHDRKNKDDNFWMEWQADYMASALLMPKDIFTSIAKKKFQQIGIKNGFYRLGSDFKSDFLVESLYMEIAELFDTSLTATKIRFKNLGLVITKTKNEQLHF